MPWRARINRLLNEGGAGLRIAYQPIHRVDDRSICGHEALSRFPRVPELEGRPQTPDRWFAEADLLGFGVELELLAAALALEGLPHLPAYLGVNLSPATLITEDVLPILDRYGDRLLIEMTEHAVIVDYEPLVTRIARIRSAATVNMTTAARLAIDDVGAGHSGLAHIVKLQPDVLKVDVSIVRGVDTDAWRQATIRWVARFARELGISIVAEGVETEGEFAAVADLGVDAVQGYLLSRPEFLA